MVKADWKSVTKDDVLRAVRFFLEENPEYPAPRSTFLVIDGKKLPAKHIRGMAYKVASGIELSKENYAGGMETVRFFERLGFEVFYTGSVEHTKAKKPVPPENGDLGIAHKEVATQRASKATACAKTVIPFKGVVEQKNALQLMLNRLYAGDIVCEKTFYWLKTPEIIEGIYSTLYKALSAYRGDTTFAKKNVVLRCDFVCESQKLIIEYDERQHFSEARKIALEAYKNVSLCYDRALWIKACSDIQAKDGNPANRDEVRAYYDSTRDIEAAKHGYRLVRIMHGQIDFERPDALSRLESLLHLPVAVSAAESAKSDESVNLKIAMYLQTERFQNKSSFAEAMSVIKRSKPDVLVFPEFGWVPFHAQLERADIADKAEINKVYDACVDFSRKMGLAVVVCSMDRFGTIYSVFANAAASEEETQCAIYMKHTMTSCSPFEFEGYQTVAKMLFTPIRFRGYSIGLTICYDCNHALFSRMYGVQGVDMLINCTGGNVVYDKWYKYNQCRAIENHCYCLVTMGGEGGKDKPNSYVYGFNRDGKELHPRLLNGDSAQTNVPGGLYLYDLVRDDHKAGSDTSIHQIKTENKKQDFYIPVGNVDSILCKAAEIDTNLYVYPYEGKSIVFCVIDGDNIIRAEAFLPMLYSPKLRSYAEKRYILVCRFNNLTPEVFENKLSLILKVRAMENFCAVLLESDNENNCYQTGLNKTAQILKPIDGMFGLDLTRMSGPEAIWKNKGTDFKASWRTNFTWLVGECERLSQCRKSKA